jgi:hypothetical protein
LCRFYNFARFTALLFHVLPWLKSFFAFYYLSGNSAIRHWKLASGCLGLKKSIFPTPDCIPFRPRQKLLVFERGFTCPLLADFADRCGFALLKVCSRRYARHPLAAMAAFPPCTLHSASRSLPDGKVRIKPSPAISSFKLQLGFYV